MKKYLLSRITNVSIVFALISVFITATPSHATIGKYQPGFTFLAGRAIPVDRLALSTKAGFSLALAFDFFPAKHLSFGITGEFARLPGKPPYYTSRNALIKELRFQGKVHIGTERLNATVIELGAGLFDNSTSGQKRLTGAGAVIGLSQRISLESKNSALELAFHVHGSSDDLYLTLRIGVVSL